MPKFLTYSRANPGKMTSLSLEDPTQAKPPRPWQSYRAMLRRQLCPRVPCTSTGLPPLPLPPSLPPPRVANAKSWTTCSRARPRTGPSGPNPFVTSNKNANRRTSKPHPKLPPVIAHPACCGRPKASLPHSLEACPQGSSSRCAHEPLCFPRTP